MRQVLLFCVFYFLSRSTTFAEAIPHWSSQPTFRNYSMQNGLPADNCFRIQQDQQGKIWVGTIHGIAVYNGFTWRYFQQEQLKKEKKLPSNWIMDLVISSNEVWFHSDRGVGSISPKNNSVRFSKNLHLGWGKLTLFNHQIYTSTWRGIVNYQLKDGKISSPRIVPNSENESCIQLVSTRDQLYGIFEDKPGFFVITKTNQLKHLYPKLTAKKVPLNISQLYVKSAEILLATFDQGIISYNLRTGRIKTIVNSAYFSGTSIRCLKEYTYNAHTYLIVGTNGNGVMVFNESGQLISHWKHIPEISDSSLQSDIIQDIFVDQEKGIWLSTDKGISYLHPKTQFYKPLYLYGFKELPSQALINCVSPITNEKIFIGTDQNGAYLLDYSTNTSRKVPETENSSIIGITSISPSTSLIITAHSLQLIDKNTLSKKWIFPIKEQVFGCSISKKGMLAIGTNKGVKLFDMKLRKYIFEEEQSDRESSELITKAVYFDDRGTIWALRFFNGLQRFKTSNSKRIFSYTPAEIVNRGTDFHTLHVSKNELIVSSSEGIFVHPLSSPEKAVHYTTANGLEGNIIDRFYLSSKKESYYTTPTGFYLFDFTSKQSHLIHRIEKNTQKWFNDITEDKNGTIWFTVSNYLVRFNPTKIQLPIQSPRIEYITINDKSITDFTQLHVPDQHASLDIQLIDSHFESNTVSFEYRIPGIQTAWKPVSNGKISLEGIASGDYQIEIHALQLANGQSSKLTAIPFTVDQAFYFKWWFYALISILIGLVIWQIQRNRFRQKEKIYQTRLQVSRDLHDELGANVSSIQIMANLLENQISESDKTHSFVTNISNYSKQINETINDIIWNVNPKNDDTLALINRIKRFAQLNFDATGARLHIEENIKQEELPIDNITRQYLYFIVKEALNNCAKYSTATDVWLHFKINKSMIKMEVIDNGIGFIPDKSSGKGNGISNMQRRAQEIKAQLAIYSKPGEGTQITLILKR